MTAPTPPAPASDRAAAFNPLEPPVSHPASEAARLRRLLEAQSLITGDLELTDLLGRVVRTACELVEARYGGIGVVGDDGRLERFVHRGLEPAAARLAENGTLPRPALRRAMHEAESAVRIDDLHDHAHDELHDDPHDLGFDLGDERDVPEDFPVIRSFLGVPIRVGGELFGDIYLSDPRPAAFTAGDEELVQSLAVTAGSAIANARLLDEANRSRHWLRAAGDVARALLAAGVEGEGTEQSGADDAMVAVVDHAMAAAQADLGILLLPDPDGTLRPAVVAGVDAARFRARTFPPNEPGLGRLLGRGTAFLRPAVAGLVPDGDDNPENLGPVMAAPLADPQGLRGSLLLVRTADRRPYRQADLDMLRTYADQVAVAMDLDDARTDSERLRLLEVRHHVSRELHDTVVQRLFATGVTLHALTDAGLAEPQQTRLQRCVTDLDDTIDEIREQVLALRGTPATAPAARRFPRVVVAGSTASGGVDTPPMR